MAGNPNPAPQGRLKKLSALWPRASATPSAPLGNLAEGEAHFPPLACFASSVRVADGQDLEVNRSVTPRLKEILGL